MGRIFVLSGSSACGKTTLMNNVLRETPSLSVVQKYGTRRQRPARDGIEDDVCQVFDSPLPESIGFDEVGKRADGFISSIWKIDDGGACRVRKNPPAEKRTILAKLVGNPDFLTAESETTFDRICVAIARGLGRFYDLENGILEMKTDITNDEKRVLSNILEDLEIRTPLIVLGQDEYWGDHGQRVQMRGPVDIAYALNKGQYGICTESIRHEIATGKNVITILSDFRIINRLKAIFADVLTVVYVASAVDPAKLEMIQIGRLGIDSAAEEGLRRKLARLNASVKISKWGNVAKWIHQLNEDWKSVKPDAESTAIRSERIKTFHTRYIDNITLFDHVVLNYNEGHPEDMTTQFCNIMAVQEKRCILKESPLFVVAAASNAGKGTMMEMLNLIGSDRVQILSKIAKRKPKRNDKKDGMLPIGTHEKPLDNWAAWPHWWTKEMISIAKKGEFPQEYDFSWTFHGKSVHYAVSDQEIRHNLDRNKPQIIISNTDQFDNFIERYGNRVVFILLYRLSSIEDTRDYYMIEEGLSREVAEARAEEVTKVLQEYIAKINHFSHVILNTTRPEDLYDQIFQLVEHYHGE